MAHLRVASDEDIVSSPIADAINTVAKRAINANATVFLAAWETPDGAIHVQPVPGSKSVLKGMVGEVVGYIMESENAHG